jgi:Zn-dependent M28 family amino/carboxypeptidase
MPPERLSVATSLLAEPIETLARLDRTPGSAGEREAAVWLADRFRAAGCDVSLEEEPTWGTFPPTITGIGLLGLWGAWRVARRRRSGVLLSLASLAGFLDEIQNGPRIVRRALRTRKTTTNVVATVEASDASRTLVVLAHHDAAQTGRIFDQRWAMALHRVAPDLMQRGKKQIPQWWIGIAPIVLTTLAAATGSKRVSRWSLGFGLAGLAVISDIQRSPTVPGANDNLSGVAVQLGLAEMLRERPLDDLRVLLVSCGAEETLQDGIRGFMARHRDDLPPGRTWFLNFDTVGSTHLVMLEGEGPAWMEDYADPSFRDLVADAAASAGVQLERGLRARASTDSVIPSRAGYPTATLVSVMPWRLPGNYHLRSDTPENVDLGTVADAVKVAYGVAEKLTTMPA